MGPDLSSSDLAGEAREILPPLLRQAELWGPGHDLLQREKEQSWARSFVSASLSLPGFVIM